MEKGFKMQISSTPLTEHDKSRGWTCGLVLDSPRSFLVNMKRLKFENSRMTSRINKYFHLFSIFASVSFARRKQKIDSDAQSHKSFTAEGRWRFEDGELNLRIDFFELSADSTARLRLHKEFPGTTLASDVSWLTQVTSCCGESIHISAWNRAQAKIDTEHVQVVSYHKIFQLGRHAAYSKVYRTENCIISAAINASW